MGLLNTGLSVKGTVAIAEELDSGANGMWDTLGMLDGDGDAGLSYRCRPWCRPG